MPGGQRQPIHDAAERGDLAAVRAELAKGVSTEVQDEGYCQTPLHRAAINLADPFVPRPFVQA